MKSYELWRAISYEELWAMKSWAIKYYELWKAIDYEKLWAMTSDKLRR